MNHYPPGPQGPAAHPYHPARRQGDYHYGPRPAATPPQPMPYPNFHPQYHAHVPAPPHYAPQWYQPYPHYPQQHAHQQYQSRSPLVVSSHPNPQQSNHPPPPPPQQQQQLAPPRHVYTPTHTPNPIPTPQIARSTTSSVSQPVASPDTSSTSLHPASSVAAVPATPPPQPAQPTRRIPFYPELPWYSAPDTDFPARASRPRRRKRSVQAHSNALELPAREQTLQSDVLNNPVNDAPTAPSIDNLEPETPMTSLPPSENDSTHPSTPASSLTTTSKPTPTAPKPHTRNATVPVIPIVPIVPRFTAQRSVGEEERDAKIATDGTTGSSKLGAEVAYGQEVAATGEISSPTSAAVKAPSKSWADMVRSKAPANGAIQLGSFTSASSGTVNSKNSPLSEALQSYTVETNGKVSFLEPRGLVNTGNMCYMNSILQSLVFCVPFYEFLDQIGKRAAHRFKSDTPLIDAMIMFMREFSVIDSTISAEQLRRRLKEKELEQYGDSFIPEYVYDVIRRLPRFSSMRRGHQQDAEEFLGFLLEGLHDECVHVMRPLGQDQQSSTPSVHSVVADDDASAAGVANADSGWLEVGPKQKPSITRSSGSIPIDSPITKIFGGNLRSELRVQGLKNSVTLEPYQPLQLDIGAPDVVNIADALRGLTRSETLHGDFNSPRGPGVKATKQVFIETLPPVLILHLKRFQYDNTGGTQKIWKKIGYPLELEIPKEVFSPSKRGALTVRPGGLPKYRLIGVVYHHGKNASGGHYTVDVRRQDGREWIRLDDTVIRRVRAEDVASEGGEEDPKVLDTALEKHKREQSAGRNIFDAGFATDKDDDEADDEQQGGWSQVNGHTTSPRGTTVTKKWSAVANGSGTITPNTAGVKTPKDRYSIKDNKVAYILFYQEIEA